MLDGLVALWDGVELWVVQLWFPVQFVLVMAVVMPLCLGAAVLFDRAADHASARLKPPRE